MKLDVLKTISNCRGHCLGALLLALAAMLAIAVALWQLTAASAGLRITETQVGGVPITLYRPAGDAPAPSVVIAHGFAGSRQLMQPYAITLARNGYLAVTFDFPGHGRNPAPFVASLMDQEARLRVLLDALEPAVNFALQQPGADGRLALLGHSMAGDVLARYSQMHPDLVEATVLLSPYLSEDAPTAQLRNLLLVYGELEPDMLHQQGFKTLAKTVEGGVESGTLYGDPADGNARRLMLAEGVEHIGVLYGRDGLAAALDWLNQTFERTGTGFLDARGPWLGLLYLGLLTLAWPLSRWLPRAATQPMGAGLGWRRLLPVALAPALLTPLILWKLPTDFLPILLGDYLALHFAVYGLITALGVWLTHDRSDQAVSGHGRFLWRGFAIATIGYLVYITLAFSLTTDRFVTTLLPGPERLPLVLAMMVGTLGYFVADEWLTRGAGAARGGYALTKALFLFSLLGAVALNLDELFFLIIIVPAILVFFLVYGVMSGWVYRRVQHPLVAAIGNGIAFACATAVTFPVVGG
ncbi:alpha/beta hydrolase [Thiocystis violascens]|uniref:Lysophospholipase n=1 Tax=Thiocystis violascens (strain ATCC 17096 / DSM 198 / 6111) TaxID=765911 RepID=I3Y7Y3_THIV6|nr:alpha/beta fold hydrolase [Thiocystis violascens]AFL73101.1 lysophospholipase [Thiocystis violascens DSM 198]